MQAQLGFANGFLADYNPPPVDTQQSRYNWGNRTDDYLPDMGQSLDDVKIVDPTADTEFNTSFNASQASAADIFSTANTRYS